MWRHRLRHQCFCLFPRFRAPGRPVFRADDTPISHISRAERVSPALLQHCLQRCHHRRQPRQLVRIHRITCRNCSSSPAVAGRRVATKSCTRSGRRPMGGDHGPICCAVTVFTVSVMPFTSFKLLVRDYHIVAAWRRGGGTQHGILSRSFQDCLRSRNGAADSALLPRITLCDARYLAPHHPPRPVVVLGVHDFFAVDRSHSHYLPRAGFQRYLVYDTSPCVHTVGKEHTVPRTLMKAVSVAAWHSTVVDRPKSRQRPVTTRNRSFALSPSR